MKKKSWSLELLSCKIIWGLSFLIFLLLTGTSLIFTRYFAADYKKEIPYMKISGNPWTILGAVLLGILLCWMIRYISEETLEGKRQVHKMLVTVLVWCFAFGTIWVMFAVSMPVADQYSVADSAKCFIEGNYGYLNYGEYLFYYPFQLGLVAWEELIFRLFGVNNYIALQMGNVFGIIGSIYAGYKVVWYLFDSRKTEAAYLLLTASCFPFLIYSSYIYNDVLSVCLSLVVIWQMLRLLKTGKKSSICWMVIAGTMAVLIRSNSLIVLIAVGCILFIKAIVQKKWLYLGCIVLLGIGAVAGRRAVFQYYEVRTGVEINSGMPSTMWIAMGMQEGDKEAGWYNGYSLRTYREECQYQNSVAKVAAIKEINSRIKVFEKNPGYAADFYFRKFTSQWNDPTYGCFIMTYATERERNLLGNGLYKGMPKNILEHFMDAYQLLIYGTVLVLLNRKKKEKNLEWYVLLIIVIGGILFSELWEAKSRYVLPYFIMMLPMAAAGLTELENERRKR